VEFELDGWKFGCEEGFAASVGASITDVFCLRNALDAEHLLAWSFALDQIWTEIEADAAFVVLVVLLVFDVVSRVVA
jgi:hypothetical protein